MLWLGDDFDPAEEKTEITRVDIEALNSGKMSQAEIKEKIAKLEVRQDASEKTLQSVVDELKTINLKLEERNARRRTGDIDKTGSLPPPPTDGIDSEAPSR